MDYVIGLFFLVIKAIVQKLALPFIIGLAVATLVIGGIAAAAGGNFMIAAKYTVYGGLVIALVGSVIGALVTINKGW